MSALTGLEALVLGASGVCTSSSRRDDGGGGMIMTSPEGITVAVRPAAVRLTDRGALHKQKRN